MNDINLLGRLTNTSELKKSANGRDHTWFTVAVPRQDNPRQEADYIRCMAFDKLAAAIYKHCAKGRQVLCQGRLQLSTSIDEVTKQVKYHHTVVVSATHFLHDPNVSSPSV
ncbi:single-stranded DNA-binding protein [Lactobacillus helveticus]|uniref:single-stranded DNA-binding protein n=1 Tax=Lactobacillus helveticus TaxID=1587 RepID=UPI0015627E4C|nr:single-stranded DNA-binding protein [Lactobacillus helveticus]NRO49373.1 Single-stranded DNA-binding protein [Lactobacillus helveticus]NRO79049.1 Single-stranded DNA-binding protein [Lactobacillus helveticus]NRO83160.1 Single-stranded DNA-binding protein [Lactobacillus helveticus]